MSFSGKRDSQEFERSNDGSLITHNADEVTLDSEFSGANFFDDNRQSKRRSLSPENFNININSNDVVGQDDSSGETIEQATIKPQVDYWKVLEQYGLEDLYSEDIKFLDLSERPEDINEIFSK